MMMEDLLTLLPTPIMLPRLEASDQLTRGPYVDKPPGTVFFVHGVFVGLSHEAEGTHFWFGEIVKGSWKTSHFAVIEFYAAGVLLAAPDHLLFFFALAFGEDVRRDRHRGN